MEGTASMEGTRFPIRDRWSRLLPGARAVGHTQQHGDGGTHHSF